MIQAPEPPPVVVTVQAEPVVVSRKEGTEIVAAQDMALTLTKAARREDALVRRAIFITTSMKVTRPAEAQDAARDSYAWTYKAFLQRQVCFSSITGLFACTTPELETLPETDEGSAPLTAPDVFPQAEAARKRLTETLRARSAAVFEADRKAHADPLFKAAGVTAVRAAPPR